MTEAHRGLRKSHCNLGYDDDGQSYTCSNRRSMRELSDPYLASHGLHNGSRMSLQPRDLVHEEHRSRCPPRSAVHHPRRPYYDHIDVRSHCGHGSSGIPGPDPRDCYRWSIPLQPSKCCYLPSSLPWPIPLQLSCETTSFLRLLCRRQEPLRLW